MAVTAPVPHYPPMESVRELLDRRGDLPVHVLPDGHRKDGEKHFLRHLVRIYWHKKYLTGIF